MLTVKRNHAKPPAGGHRFIRGNVALKGETVEEVLKQIEEHRAQNALPLGDPEGDLAVYYKAIAPYLVKEVEGDGRTVFRSVQQAESLMQFWKMHPEVMHRDDARIALRLAHCENCPLKAKFFKDQESERIYVREATRRAALLCENRDFADKGRCHWANLPIDLITRVKEPQELEGLPPVPKPCWVNSL